MKSGFTHFVCVVALSVAACDSSQKSKTGEPLPAARDGTTQKLDVESLEPSSAPSPAPSTNQAAEEDRPPAVPQASPSAQLVADESSTNQAADESPAGSAPTSYDWENQPEWRWLRDFSKSPRDDFPPPGDLQRENIGWKTRVYQRFDRWKMNGSISADRGQDFADVSKECRGKIEMRYALDPQEWQNASRRRQYFRDIDELITVVGDQLLKDFASPLKGEERKMFLRGLRALAWQESNWQHYVRYKKWFFVFLSGGSYNKLDDWGITQVARSGFEAHDLMNKKFFDKLGHCSISGTLYYGFMEYYFGYLQARSNACNNGDTLSQLVGAYNYYSSGANVCHNGFSNDRNYRDYQQRAMGGFRTHFRDMPWLKERGAAALQ